MTGHHDRAAKPVSSEPVSSEPVPRETVSREPVSREPAAVAKRRLLRPLLLMAALGLPLAGAVTLPPAPAAAESVNAGAKFFEALNAGKYREAESWAKRILDYIGQRQGKRHDDYAHWLVNLGRVYNRQARYDEAMKVYRQALAIFERTRGANDKAVAATLNNLGNVLEGQKKLDEAIATFQRSLKIYEILEGREGQSYSETLQNLANAYVAQARYAEAIALYQQAAQTLEQKVGPRELSVANAYDNMAVAYQAQANYADAIRSYKIALDIYQEKLGEHHTVVANTKNNLANVYFNQGRYAEALDLYSAALAVYEDTLSPDHPNIGNTLDNMANIYRNQGRFAESEPLFKRALAIKEKSLGRDHPSVANTLNNMAIQYQQAGRYAEAQPLLERALTIYEKVLGRGHPFLADVIDNLGMIQFGQNHLAAAIRDHEKALAIREKALGKDHPKVATTLLNLGNIYYRQTHYGEAAAAYERARDIEQKALGKGHPQLANILDNLASTAYAQGDREQALAYSRDAAAVLTESQRRANAGQAASDSSRRDPLKYIYGHLVGYALAVADRDPSARPALTSDALAAAQRFNATSVSAALSQMAARFGTDDKALGKLVREQQDLAARWQSLDNLLIQTLSQPADKRSAADVAKLRRQRAEIEKRQDAIFSQLDKQFPQYRELISPKPLSVGDIQKLLQPDEALVVYLVLRTESFVWAITRDEVRWQPLGPKLNADGLAERVTALRKGLKIEAAAAGEDERFNLQTAHTLYRDLLGPVEDLVRDHKSLLIVPTGALTSLPFNVLVTETPAQAVPQDAGGYRDAAWLIKRNAITILPSVSSLKALRVFASRQHAREPFIGFGDPVFGDDPSGSARGTTADLRSFRSYFKGTRANRDALVKALPPLPGTATELKAVAKSLGVPDDDVRLGRQASEGAVKSLDLDRYRIVYFATHGLVAGETALVADFAEPALALTIPKQVSDKDDGLLTSSEVASLKLNADWVVLSACNTAAGDRPGAEALSGLAKAFIYAGARSLLVSHWPVGDEAAARLTSDAFAKLKADPELGRAQALRQSMLDMLGDTGSATNAYPAYWAPFIVVGDGGR